MGEIKQDELLGYQITVTIIGLEHVGFSIVTTNSCNDDYRASVGAIRSRVQIDHSNFFSVCF